ncbi:MAG: N-acetylglucosamine-6-phosphate deacetylase [Acidobacteriota bacterium]
MQVRGNLPDDSGAVLIVIDGDVVSAVEILGPANPRLPYVSPGFIDLQLNGFAGVDFSASDLTAEQLHTVLPSIWRTGVTAFCPTLITMSQRALIRNLGVMEEARRRFPDFARTAPCYHVEGPYFSPSKASGVHEPKWMRPPAKEDFQELQQAAGGHIGLVTLGPEVPGALDFIRYLSGTGVAVAVSHTEASPDLIHQAADAGVILSTHLGNGCPQLLDRQRAPFWAQLTDDRLAASLICDSYHLAPDMLRLIRRVKGAERCILISDSSHIAGLPPGRYKFLRTDVELLPGGKVIRADGGSLACASVGLDRGVMVYCQQTGASLAEALATVTRNPARLIPQLNLTGELRSLERADLVMFRFSVGGRTLKIENVIVAGKSRQSCSSR